MAEIVEFKTGQQQNDERRSFVAQKLGWLDVVVRDPKVSHLEFRLAYLISGYLNQTTGDAWPSQPRLAQELGVTTRSVQRCMDALVELGHLRVEVGRGRNRTNRYAPAENTTPMSPLVAENTTRVSSLTAGKHDTHVAFSEKTRHLGQENTTPVSGKHDTGVVQTPLSNTSKKNPRIESIFADFDQFWHAYPKRVSKGDAEKAYQSIIKSKKATPEQLLAGATRYAAEQSGKELQFVKHAGRWLRSKCWLDEPQPTTTSPPPSSRVNRADSAVAGIASFLEDGGRYGQI